MFNSDSTSKHTTYAALGGAGILFAAFVGIALLQKPKPSSASKSVDSKVVSIRNLADRAQIVVDFELPEFESWSDPVAEDADQAWLYDVFTPPRIYINPETGDFEPTAYQFEQKLELPSLALIQVSRPLFRFQLAGYIENSLIDPEQSILLIEDRSEGQTKQIRFHRGAALSADFQVQSFKIKRESTEAGAIVRSGLLTIVDSKGKQIEMSSASPTYVEGYEFELAYGDHHFFLTTETPTFANELYRVRLMIEKSMYPNFLFEVFDNATSSSRHFSFQSYLPE